MYSHRIFFYPQTVALAKRHLLNIPFQYPNIEKDQSERIGLFLVGEDGFAFLRKSHGGCDMPPACR